jgi:hypothetical protein
VCVCVSVDHVTLSPTSTHTHTDLHFPPVVYKKLLGIPFSLADLVDVDPDLYRGFVDLLAFTGRKQCVSSVYVCMCVAALCPDNMQ